MEKVILSPTNYTLDTSTVGAYQEIIENSFNFSQVYGVKRDYTIKANADEILGYFLSAYPDIKYRIFYGGSTLLWTDSMTIRFRGDFHEAKRVVNKRFEEDIIFTGRRDVIPGVVDAFDKHFENAIVSNHLTVDMIVRGANGLDSIRLPIKSERKFYPEMYPVLRTDPRQYINDFLESPANVLIMIGDPGLGKSALINEIVLSARKFTQIIYDKEVMKTDQLYSDFINRSLREDGGLMVMEDADIVLSDRVMTNNETMSRILNMSDGIVDTSGAKFILSANIQRKEDIDSALTRPGRCFDIVEFRPLTYDEAVIASQAIGKELFDHDKNEYTVAEIFNATPNRREKKFSVGFM